MRIVAFLCVLFAVLHSQAAEFPKEGWWAIPGFANAAGGATYNLLRLQRYTPAAATIPGLEPPKPIQDHPEQAWVLTFFRVEMATADADNLKLQRDSCLARITADSISCFSLAENLYRYSVVDDAVIWEFVRSDLESSFGFSHLFPPLENKKLTFKPTSPMRCNSLKSTLFRGSSDERNGNRPCWRRWRGSDSVYIENPLGGRASSRLDC
jgi:hypothetical protein